MISFVLSLQVVISLRSSFSDYFLSQYDSLVLENQVLTGFNQEGCWVHDSVFNNMQSGCISVSTNTNIVIENSLFYCCVNSGPAVLSFSSTLKGCVVSRVCSYDCYSSLNSYGQILIISTDGDQKCLTSCFTKATYQNNRGMFTLFENGIQHVSQCNYSFLSSSRYSDSYMKNAVNGKMEYSTHSNNVATSYICLGFAYGTQDVVFNNVINNSCPASSYAVFYNDYHGETYASNCVFYINNGVYFGHYGGVMKISNSWSDKTTYYQHNSEGSISIDVYANDHRGHTLNHFSTAYCYGLQELSTLTRNSRFGFEKIGVFITLIQ